jgi:lipopolysaccharide transport system permease protein
MLTADKTGEQWDLVMRPRSSWFDLHLQDVWHYRDLLWLFVRRDFVTVYKQTILGPLWFFIQPILTTLVFTVVFTGIAKVPTDGLPPVLFYLAGTTCWNYFAACLNKTSNTFVGNAHLFGKVYFPRLISPLAVVASNLVQFAIQFLLFACIMGYYLAQGTAINPSITLILLLTPILLLIMGLIGLGMGILISALTTKYRDFTFLVGFGVQLAMYATPVVYPSSAIPEKYAWFLQWNPVSPVIEAFRTAYLGSGSFTWGSLTYSAVFAVIVFLAGAAVFNRIEKTFMDTV